MTQRLLRPLSFVMVIGAVIAGLALPAQGEPGEIPPGLEKDEKRCPGLFLVRGTGMCTAGPQVPPPGFALDRMVAPLTAAEMSGAEAGTAGVVCEGDGVTGNRVQVLYARESTNTDNYAKYLQSFRFWARGIDQVFNESAARTGGSRHVRYVTTGTGCEPVVSHAALPAGSLAEFGTMVNALKAAGYNRSDRKYLIFMDADIFCGLGHLFQDDRPGAENFNNGGQMYAAVGNGCWTINAAAHELGHTMGAVQNTSPNASGHGHCTDDHDLMCYQDGSGIAPRLACRDISRFDLLDCGNNDYFHTAPPAGSWLATHWNVANNQFLIKGTAVENDPPAFAGRAYQLVNVGSGLAVEVAGGTPTAQARLVVAASAATDNQRWTLQNNGGLVNRQTGRCAAMFPNSTNLEAFQWPCGSAAYARWSVQSPVPGQFVITSLQSGQVLTQVGAAGSVLQHQPYAAGNQSQLWRMVRYNYDALRNDGTYQFTRPGEPGDAIEVRSGSTADAARLLNYLANGDPEQRWRAQARGTDWRLVNINSGKCLDGGSAGVAGSEVFQQTCTEDAWQRWELRSVNGRRALVNRHSGLAVKAETTRTVNLKLAAYSATDTLQQWDVRGTSDQELGTGRGYLFINMGTDEEVEVQGASTVDGARIVTAFKYGWSEGTWRLVASGGYWQLTNALSGKCLSLVGGSAAVLNGQVEQATCATQTWQQWSLRRWGDGTYILFNRKSGGALTRMGRDLPMQHRAYLAAPDSSQWFRLTVNGE